jgi:hypothetical protein
MLTGKFWRSCWGRIFICFVAVAALAGAVGPGPQMAPGTSPHPIEIPQSPLVNPMPDANDRMRMREENAKKQDFVAANTERKKQIAEDSAKLLKLATDLKAEVDKTNKETLSLAVIRKADEIERLAHNVKEKMKLTVGSN